MRLRQSLPSLLLAAAAALLPATAARADFLPAQPIDGPTADLVGQPDVDLARDGSGAVAYLKLDGGVRHVFVSRFVDGVFQAPERIDAGLTGAAAQPAVAASDGGRLVVAWVSGGQVYAITRSPDAAAYNPLQLLAASGSDPSADMSINGAAYVSFTAAGASAADVRVARMPSGGTQLTTLADPLDIDPAQDAGTGTGRSEVAISADGTGVVVWGEAGHVYARRVFGERISAAPQDLNIPALQTAAGGAADLPDVDIEDDSSYAWAVFRQRFADGRAHAIARRLVGSQFEAPAQVDAVGFPGVDDVSGVDVAISGRGEGIAGTSTASGGSAGAVVHDDLFNPAVLLDPGNALAPRTAVGVAENNDAYVVSVGGSSAADASVQAVPYDIDPAKRTAPPPGAPVTISDPALGPVDGSAGLGLGVDRAGDASAVFVQGTGDAKRLVAGGFDRAPGAFRTYTSSKLRRYSRPPLSWQTSFELWGAVSYAVEIDGKPVGTTTATKLTPTARLRDGTHRWRVVATDRRGQTAATKIRFLRVDATKPALSVKVTGSRRRGKGLKVAVRAADGSLRHPRGSGIARVRIDFGDGTRVDERRATHRYGKSGAVTLRVSATDKAGNARTVTRRLHIGR
jgi:PKD domain-containing protein